MTASSSNTPTPPNFISIYQAADLELKRLAHPFAQSQQPAPAPSVWWPFNNTSTPIPPLVSLYQNFDSKHERAALVHEVEAQKLSEENTQILNTIKRIYNLFSDRTETSSPEPTDKPSPNRSETPNPSLPASDAMTASPSHNDRLTDIITHVDTLENARQELLLHAACPLEQSEKDNAIDLANTLLKRKVRFLACEIEVLEKQNQLDSLYYELKARLKDDLDTLFPLLEKENANRAYTIYKNLCLNWELEPLIPSSERDFDATIPDANKYFKSLLDQEQQLSLEYDFIKRCVRYHATLWEDIFKTNSLQQQKAFHEEHYYLLCREVSVFEALLSERNASSRIEDSFIDVALPTATNTNDQETLSSHLEAISSILETLYTITGKIRANQYINPSDNTDPITPPIQYQLRYISPDELNELRIKELDTEKSAIVISLSIKDTELRLKQHERILELVDEIIDLTHLKIDRKRVDYSNVPSSSSMSLNIDSSGPDPFLAKRLGDLIELKQLAIKGIQLLSNSSKKPINLKNTVAWKEELWGKLLFAKSRDPVKNEMRNAFKASFEENLTKLTQLNSEVNHHNYNELLTTKISYHGTILARIIDKMGEYAGIEEDLKQKLEKLDEQPSQERSEILKKLDTIDKYKKALQAAFQEQLDIYQKIPQPKKEIWELVQEQVQNEAREYLTLGLYAPKRYITPDEFLTKFRYSEAGYSFQKAVQLWSEWKGNNPIEILKGLVNEFLTWADDNPRDAARLASDILLTISIFCNESLFNTLSQQINAKIFVSSVLGTMSNDNSEKPITREHLKFRALAEMARAAPKAASGIVAAKNALSQTLQTGLLGGLWSGISTYANTSYMASAVQRAANALTHDTAQVARVAFALMRGDSMQEIVTSQAMIELVSLVGNIRRAYLTPGAIMKEAMRKLAAPFQEFWHARGGASERVSRLAALTITVITPSVLVGASLFTATVGGIFVAAIATIVSSVFLMSIYVGKLHPLVNWVWEKTPHKLNKERILEAHRDDINNHVDAFLSDLRAKGVIQGVIAPVDYPETEAVAERFYRHALAQLQANPGDTLQNVLQRFVKETNVETIKAYALQSPEGRRASSEQFEHFATIVCEKAADRLITDWLYPKIQDVITKECVSRLLNGDKGKQKPKALLETQTQALKDLTTRLTRKASEPTEIDKVKGRLVEITKKR